MNLRRILSDLRNFRSLLTGRAPAPRAPVDRRRPTRRRQPAFDTLEDRQVPATYFVDGTNPLPGSGTQDDPFATLQQAMTAATGNAAADTILVYGNGNVASSTPYIW